MAKKSIPAKSGAKTGGTKSFEEQLGRLEKLGEQIKRNDIPLDEALAAFEEGIRLARTLEKSLEKIENRIEILMNSTEALADESPEMELFDAGE
ncbi:exodeoxyribonuclease VII small subunit [Treponema sp. R8-4-B8]